MQITDVEVTIVSIPLRRPIAIATRWIDERTYSLVQVHTDSGLSGIGLSYEAAGVLVDRILKKAVIKKDPFERETIWNTLYGCQGTSHGRWGATLQAIGAIDVALWDIVGKALETPLYKMLGGYKREVPCYASAGYYEKSKGPQELAEEMRDYVKRGFRAVKIRVGGVRLSEDVERVKAVRKAIGPEVHLMVDANNVYDCYQALKAGKAFEKFDVFWFEEPVSPDDVQGCATLSHALDTPIACGELESGKHRFRELMDAKSLDIAQPDVSVCGGITEWIKIAAIAEAYKIPLAPHSLHDIHVHLAAANRNTLFVEFFDKEADLTKYSDLYIGYNEPVDGFLVPSDKPGLGIEPNYDVLERHSITYV